MANNYHIFIDTNVLVNYKTGQQKDIVCLNYLFSRKRKEVLHTSVFALGQAASMLQSARKGRHAFTSKQITEYFHFLFTKINVSDFSIDDLKDAINLKYKDIEDNIQYIISKKAKCNLIITNNTKDFAEILDVETMKPERISMLKKKLNN